MKPSITHSMSPLQPQGSALCYCGTPLQGSSIFYSLRRALPYATERAIPNGMVKDFASHWTNECRPFRAENGARRLDGTGRRDDMTTFSRGRRVVKSATLFESSGRRVGESLNRHSSLERRRTKDEGRDGGSTARRLASAGLIK